MDLTTARPLPPVPRRDARVHDGFYLRFASGFGAYSEGLESETSDVYDGKVRGRTRGLASVGEFAIGGTLPSGVVLGLGLYTSELLTASFRTRSDSADVPPAELDPEFRSLTILGPFLDWYPNPRRGFHAQAALGVASLSTDNFEGKDDDEDYNAFGAGLVLGLGHEWWIGNEWSLGALMRGTVAIVSGKDDSDVRWVHGVATSPSLLLSVTYH